ncbi:MAG: hypothetical protein HZB51_21995 [Chloroflexi bacterium]|nr:hypothetical protein [Chloroflexota bacterium]
MKLIRSSPIRRNQVEFYLLLTLMTLALSVVLTRVFLQLTGYPQLGNSYLHIAHVLWGGLLLYIAALLPLILVNRWALTVSAILNGTGVGLFIDEVGKFITRDNNYFYRPAAPIIYAFFLLSVLLLVYVHKPRQSNPREALYHASEELPQVIDRPLSVNERAYLIDQLQLAQRTGAQSLARLAAALNSYLQDEELRVTVNRLSVWEELAQRPVAWAKHLPRQFYRILISGFLFISGLFALLEVASLVTSALFSNLFDTHTLSFLVTVDELRSVSDYPWFQVRIFLEGAVGVVEWVACYFLLTRREARGIQTAIFGLVLSLTTVVLLTFYLDQFGALVGALFEFSMLLFLLAFRRWYGSSANVNQ